MSIFLLVVYFNTAFAVGIDYHYCQGKVANVKLKLFGKAECKDAAREVPMGCCKNETKYCQTDDHQAQVAATILPAPSGDYDNGHNMPVKTPLAYRPEVTNLYSYVFIRSRCSREILSLIQVLRI